MITVWGKKPLMYTLDLVVIEISKIFFTLCSEASETLLNLSIVIVGAIFKSNSRSQGFFSLFRVPFMFLSGDVKIVQVEQMVWLSYSYSPFNEAPSMLGGATGTR